MRSNTETVSLVDYGEVIGPSTENVQCPRCGEVNPKGRDTCKKCDKLLPANA